VQRHAGEEGARRRRPQQRRREGDERERVQRVDGALPRRLEVGARPRSPPAAASTRASRPPRARRWAGRGARPRPAPAARGAAARRRRGARARGEEGVGGGVHRAAGARRNWGWRVPTIAGRAADAVAWRPWPS
jgi:hypothetical protein